MEAKRICETCKGRGWIELRCTKPDEATHCGMCNGSGLTPAGKTCPGCQGTGRIEVRTAERQRCVVCLGTGVYPLPESL